ncbi:MAG TPA: hybrid sensor histidine kinase/response regulator [Desulfobacterales bacterium]|nr:hybrid sensor histidine kinase/response regulator [Desulfobacterales bacterium]
MSAAENLNDISLLDLFLMECCHQCEILNEQLALLKNNTNPQADFSAMQRALHSVKGAARIIDLSLIIELTQALENVFRRQWGSVIPWNIIEAAVDELNILSRLPGDSLRLKVKERHDIIRQLIKNLGEELETEEPKVSSAADIENQTVEPGAETLPPLSADLFDIFRQDAGQHLSLLSENILKLERNPQDSLLLTEGMRAVHSIKGAARIIELHDIVGLTHAMEDVLVRIQNNSNSMPHSTIDVLLGACDLLQALINSRAGEVDQWLTGNRAVVAASIKRLKDESAGTTAGPLPALQIQSAEENETTSKAQSLRVSAQGMDRLMNLAGEAIIEADWLPSMLTNALRWQQKEKEIWAAVSGIRKHLQEQGMPQYLEDSFSYLHDKIKLCSHLANISLTDIDDHVQNAATISHRLRQEVVNNRMQPLADGTRGLPRLVRDLSLKQGKNIRFTITGAETMVDRDILEKLEAPLTHLITNAVDHGIESPEERQRAAKPPEAVVSISARHMHGRLYITIADDGRGIDLPALRRRIVDKRLVSEQVAAELSEAELLEFVFLPNFSTREMPNQTSGRGVGLDVVRNIITQVRGSVDLTSIPGYGCCFELCLPLTLSIIRALIVEINNEPYAVPLVNIDHTIRLKRSEIKAMEGRRYIISHEKRVGIIAAQQVLDLDDNGLEADPISIIVLENEHKPYGLIVDELQGIRDLVVQSLNDRLGKLRSISAAAVAPDGTPILILDVMDLINTMDHMISGNRLRRVESGSETSGKQRKRVLVVDDSATVREVERTILARHGFLVDTADDGLQAWNNVREKDYQLVITDVDMPNMDGIELLSQIREQAELEDLPVIIVSYKDREEDRQRGLTVGADYYLTKGSFSNQRFIEAVEDLIGAADDIEEPA